MQGQGKTTSSQYGSQASEGRVDQIKHKAESAADQAKSAAGDAAVQVKEKAGQVVDQAQQAVTPRLEEQKQHLTGTLSSTARALRSTSDTLRSEETPAAVSQVIDQGVQQIEKLSTYLETHSIGEIIEETEQLARRQPTMFLAGALALGFLGARFLKSSRRHLTGYEGRSSLSSPEMTSRPYTPSTASMYSPSAPSSGTSSTSPSAYTSPGQTSARDVPTTEPMPPLSPGDSYRPSTSHDA